ncbi:MAG TPA: sulfurtransferase [Gaiellaceae bacterium]|nr:sulfurtransferase [Gaiellaceae bacterium]
MLVTPDWLRAHLRDPDLVVLDLRWDEQGRGRERYEAGHIPGARFLDWASDLVDPDHRHAFMLAPPERFAAALAARGVSDDTVVVAYADAGHSGPFRLWWGASVYGHEEQVRILDGGLQAWLAAGGELTAEIPTPEPGSWTPRPSPGLLAEAADVAAARDDPRVVVLDSRDRTHFRGDTVWFETGALPAGVDGVTVTPRGMIRAGRVPWAVSIPWRSLYDEELRLLPPDALAALFAEHGVTRERKAIVYCGVGISAAALLYALRRAGIEDAALYDAGWDEWGRDPGRPVARG